MDVNWMTTSSYQRDYSLLTAISHYFPIFTLRCQDCGRIHPPLMFIHKRHQPPRPIFAHKQIILVVRPGVPCQSAASGHQTDQFYWKKRFLCQTLWQCGNFCQRSVTKGYRIQFVNRPPRFQGVIVTKVRQEGDKVFLKQELCSGERGHRTCTPPRKRQKILQLVFYSTQQRWGSAYNFRSKGPEPYYSDIQVQDANDEIWGMICDYR